MKAACARNLSLRHCDSQSDWLLVVSIQIRLSIPVLLIQVFLRIKESKVPRKGGGGWYEYLELHNDRYPLNLNLKFAYV